MPLADATTTPLPPLISWPVLLTLIVVLLASVAMFRMLVLRWTVHHRSIDLTRWARANGMTIKWNRNATLVPPLDALKSPEPVAVLTMAGEKTCVVEMKTAASQKTDTSQYTRWHAFVRVSGTAWVPTGLRPRVNPSSLLDLFPLTSFPSLLPPERFVVFGTDSSAARLLARSKLPALLPADVGLLLHGEHVVVDFSSRPFDTIELTRLAAIVDQVVANLPVVRRGD